MPTAAKHTSTKRRNVARASSRASKDDAIKLLKSDHKEVADLLSKYENGRLSKDRKEELDVVYKI